MYCELERALQRLLFVFALLFFIEIKNHLYMKTILQAKQWLIRKGVYESLCSQFNMNGYNSFNELYRNSGEQLINDGLSWARTNEGSEFWRNIHEEFVSFWNSNAQLKSYKPLFKEKDSIRIKKTIEGNIVDVNEEMTELCGKKATIIKIYEDSYIPEEKTQDGAFYYIKEDKEVNTWTCEMFRKE